MWQLLDIRIGSLWLGFLAEVLVVHLVHVGSLLHVFKVEVEEHWLLMGAPLHRFHNFVWQERVEVWFLLAVAHATLGLFCEGFFLYKIIIEIQMKFHVVVFLWCTSIIIVWKISCLFLLRASLWRRHIFACGVFDLLQKLMSRLSSHGSSSLCVSLLDELLAEMQLPERNVLLFHWTNVAVKLCLLHCNLKIIE